MLPLLPRTRHEDMRARSDYVALADGSVIEVPRANLAAAKALLAAQKAAERRVAASRGLGTMTRYGEAERRHRVS